MEPRIDTLASLQTVSGVIAVHDEVWNNSTGIIGLLKSSTACYVLTGDDGVVAGYAFVEEDRARGFVELQDIAVSAKGRGRGYGKLLMAAVLENHPRVKLVCRVANEPLVRFHEGLGFAAETTIENYYDVGEDGLRMVRGQ